MERIILFDGECNFCDASVQFILTRDTKAVFQFASLQSEIGQGLLKKFQVPVDIDSLVLLEGERYYLKSTAALRIAGQLDGLWKLMFGVILVPRPLRDAIYSYFAKNRYRWFGKKEACMLPTVEQRSRFLVDRKE
ncbi:thiol-disulfide oxidoreductase DCC family protein [Solibacillus sp. MA9]|uniref:Thiol-disulfide oxidoreductase DCC family protein n=1 Tax=Solibacillus palustris TaxID=2908203 RepID=A0ABS9UE06_9BACL|nr:thiol-disulfide oxidoreductase DCC family protein [Solibacillus sp. MA9]MCH7322225.1 thiol-disulfide oxidoreductase DCC family protein [Solibacillus sp. MA9]